MKNSNLSIAFLNRVAGLAESQEPNQFENNNNYKNDFIQLAQNHIEHNIADETFGIIELCKAIGISRSQLHNKIKARTGVSTSIFIRKIRLEKAKTILKNSNLNVSEVAYKVGFKNPTYFSRIFSKHYGITPTKLRKLRDTIHFENQRNASHLSSISYGKPENKTLIKKHAN